MRLIKGLSWIVAAVAVLAWAGQAQADPGPFPVARYDDTIPSLGTFRIYVSSAFRGLLAGCPIYNPTTFKLQSPTMYDPATVIGVSATHTHGSASDTGGTQVGTAGTIVSDASFTAVPPGFQGPAGEREVHTEIRSMNLTMLGAAVRAGTQAPARPISPGEVESKATGADIGNSAYDFPAESFFDVFVEVDMPACGSLPATTLYNSAPLIVAQDPLTDPPGLPPRVVYVHGNTSAVLVLFKNSNPPLWNAGDAFGWLVLAGHGASFTNSPADITEFNEFMATVHEMRLPGVGGLAELPGAAGDSGWSTGAYAALAGGLAAAVVALGAGAWYARRRFSRR